MGKIKLVLGTMTFGEQVFGDDVVDMLKAFYERGYDELDTAYVYNGGESEKLLGEFAKSSAKIATKVHPKVRGNLDEFAINTQFEESLKRLSVESVDTLYIHFPDPASPLEQSLKACAKLHSDGKFQKLGLSNFPAWMVADAHAICKKNGWVLPSVYEGLYNPLSRHAERELNDALNYYNMHFYAYNPLAGGLLAGKYPSFETKPESGRFANRQNYQARYWKKSFFDATSIIKSECSKENIDIVDASYRWLLNHSMLNGQRGDGIIIGVSNLRQLKEILAATNKPALSDAIVNAFSDAWQVSKSDAPEYFSFYKPGNNT